MRYRDRKYAGFRFEAPVQLRNHSQGFFGVMIDFDSPLRDYWWVDSLKKWMHDSEIPKGSWCATHAPCYSFKSFKRMLRTHPHMKGHLRLCCRYHKCDIISLR